MADFAAVLRKTIEKLGENTPEMREKVYAKARVTIEKKLAAISPKPSKSVIERQMKSLDAAIAEVESDFAVAEAPLEDLDRLLGGAEDDEASAPSPEERGTGEKLAGEAHAGVAGGTTEPAGEGGSEEETSGGAGVRERSAGKATPSPGPDHGLDKPRPTAGPEHELDEPRPTAGPQHELEEPESEGPDAIFAALHQEDKQARRRGARWLLPAGVLIIILAIAAGAWARRDLVKRYTGIDLAALTGSDQSKAPEKPKTADAEKPNAVEAGKPKPAETGKPAGGQEEKKAETTAPQENKLPEKFTQRLTENGQEVDAGPAPGQPTAGEGSSIATASQTSGQAGEVAPGDASQQKQQVLSVGQKAYLYEEGTSTDQATADAGSVVWSVIQEKPGGNAPEEPAIHAVLQIPDKNISVRLTIRRNGDETLPASHIIEVVFETPDGFGGGGISNISRVAMKDSEQATGSPLLGVPAKITDGFFLVALTDAKAAVETNLTLLQREEWIDIPVVYISGRRALFTMEKGTPGKRVFDEVLKAWQESSGG